LFGANNTISYKMPVAIKNSDAVIDR